MAIIETEQLIGNPVTITQLDKPVGFQSTVAAKAIVITIEHL